MIKITDYFSNNEEENLIIFVDGMAKLTFSDRFTITLKSSNKKLLVLDFDSRIIDYCIMNNNGNIIIKFKNISKHKVCHEATKMV